MGVAETICVHVLYELSSCRGAGRTKRHHLHNVSAGLLLSFVVSQEKSLTMLIFVVYCDHISRNGIVEICRERVSAAPIDLARLEAQSLVILHSL